MDKLDNIFKNAQAEIPDNGFTAMLMARIEAEKIQPDAQTIMMLEKLKPKRFTVFRNVAISAAACAAACIFVIKSEPAQNRIIDLAENASAKIASIDLKGDFISKFNFNFQKK